MCTKVSIEMLSDQLALANVKNPKSITFLKWTIKDN
jgi:hypothetical protein